MNPNEITEEDQIKYVKENWKNIGKLHNPSKLVQMEAVKSDIWAVVYIKNPSVDIQKISLNKKLELVYILGDLVYKLRKNTYFKEAFFIKKPSFRYLMKWIDK